MPQPFDRETWRERVAAWWREKAPDWKGTMDRLGVETAYGLLTASAFLPLLEVYVPGDPGPALAALASVVSGVGTNLLSNLAQDAYEETTAPQQVEREIAEQPELRKEYQQLLGTLDTLDAAQAALGDQWAEFEDRLQRDLKAQEITLRIKTDGGPVVFGSVTVKGGGDFVGRDKYENHYHAAPEPPDDTSLREAYLRQVVERTGRLPLRGLDVGAGDPTKAQRPRLSRVYVNLDTQSHVPKGLRGEEGRRPGFPPFEGEGDREPVSALEAAIASRRLVLLGDPGAGKSTFVRHLAFSLAAHRLNPESDVLAQLPDWPEEEADLLPVVVTLRDFARWAGERDLTEGNAGAMGDFLVRWLTNRDLADFADPLREVLRDGEAIVFFDGLDEIPTSAQRTLVRDAVADFACTYEASRILVTCRTLSYQEEDQQLPEEAFSASELAPFTDDKIERFIRVWYEELADLGAVRPEEVDVLSHKLRNAVRRSDIRRMASNPLLLTVMALVHAYRGRLPEARALLYEACTDLLLWRWEEVKVQGQEKRVPGLRRLLQEAKLQDVDFKRALWALAFGAHAQGGSEGGDDGATADIAEIDLLHTLHNLHPDESWDWAADVVQQIKERAGLLIEREPGVYAFPHRTFQEYLAACHLSVQADFAQRAVKLSEEAAFWREVVLLAVGRQVHVSGNLAQPLALVTELCPAKCGPEEVSWRRAWLAGEVLEEAGGRRVRQQGTLGRELLERVRERLTTLVEGGHLAARERSEAGDVLSRLGDPRFDPDFYFLPRRYRGEPEPFHGFVEIPAGPFVMGEGDDAHHVEIPYDYWMARYPVTVAQFGAFVDNKGYENPAWWTETGWAWRQGEWDSQVEEGWLRDLLELRPPKLHDEPMWWAEQSRTVNRPMMGVSWFEGLAYGRWLTAQIHDVIPDGYAVRLPTEAEWEKAARAGDERRYPWGNEDWDKERANIDDSQIGHANPVGMYRRGTTPMGLHEMAGNVWEWTASLYKPYPYRTEDGRNDPEAEGDRMLRGGSWIFDYMYARCAFRSRLLPDRFDNLIGLRVVVSLGSAES